ncbi:MAG: hypothetical protein ACQEXM_23565 [Actinomycetota bacterium]|uniref:hypothetical protein n=1 Tax=Pseudonocardia TaxID=1847 RepID=UPI00307E2195
MTRFTSVYGAGPGHLLLLVAGFAVAGYAALLLLDDPSALRILVWFVGVALVHDVVLFPLYSAVDRALTTVSGRLHRHGRIPLVNHVRLPLLASGLTLLVFLPGIIRQGEETHLAATGFDQQPYATAWLLLVAVFAGTSALVYVLRSAHAALTGDR